MVLRFFRPLLALRFTRFLSIIPIEKSMSNDFIEETVCQESDIPDNGMKVCDLGSDGGKVLLVKQEGKLSAIGTKCSHYGAPLINGALGNGRIRCPWHGACFNIRTGDIEDFPGLDSIPCYSVKVVDGAVKVRARKFELQTNKRSKTMTCRDNNNLNTFVIIGGGAAGQVCAETLRQEGFTGRIVLVCGEKFLPYDRIKLSKQLDSTIDKLQLRPDDFYKGNNIEVLMNTKATKLDSEKKHITLDNGQTLKYNSVFIATGNRPRKIDLPGVNLCNVFTLRSLADAEAIQASLSPTSKVVVYGSSFIGMEVAAYCVGKCESVTVIGRSKVPFQETLGQVLGGRIAALFTEKGVHLNLGKTITSIKGDTKVAEVTLCDETCLPADVVILGLGSTGATEFLQDSGVDCNPNGSVPVNQFLETNCAGIFAGGDIAEAPVFAREGSEKIAIGHWGLAHYHGRIAALNMASLATPLKTIPFFWTMLFGVSFRYAGYGAGYDDIVSGGDLEGLKYACYYCKGEKVIAVATVGVDPIASVFAERLNNGQDLCKYVVKEHPVTWHQQ